MINGISYQHVLSYNPSLSMNNRVGGGDSQNEYEQGCLFGFRSDAYMALAFMINQGDCLVGGTCTFYQKKPLWTFLSILDTREREWNQRTVRWTQSVRAALDGMTWSPLFQRKEQSSFPASRRGRIRSSARKLFKGPTSYYNRPSEINELNGQKCGICKNIT